MPTHHLAPEPAGRGTSRRSFLRGAGLAVAGALATPALSALAGCGTASTANQVSSAGDVNLPSYVPFSGPNPDLPGSAEGLPAGFYSYPATPVRAVPTHPLSGGRITAITNIFTPPPPGRDGNPAWQEVEKRLGGTLDITVVSSDDYPKKLSTVIAGGQLPDLMLCTPGGVNDLPNFLAAECADLTPLLGGDKAKDYPNLAAIPTVFWQQCTAAGKLYFLPIPRNITAGSGFVHQEIFAQAGVTDTSAIHNADDFRALLKDLTRPQANRWALGASHDSGYTNVPFYHVFGVPNGWRNSGGKLTSMYETDEFAAAVEFLARLHQDGVYVPGSESWTKAQLVDAFQSGKVAMIYDGLPAFPKYWTAMPQINPAFTPAPFIPFKHTGGKGMVWADNIVFARTMLRKGDPGHLRDVLKVCDFLASPFGTEEYLLLNYGVAGADYTLDEHHNPVPTAQGKQDATVPWKYLAAAPQVVFDPTSKSYVDTMHRAMGTLLPLAVADPTTGLYSPTDGAKGKALTQAITDAINGVIAGRTPLSGLKDAVRQWRDGGGDQIRGEYEKALAQSGGHK